MEWVDRTPLWIIALACMVVLTAAHEFGYRAGRRIVPSAGDTDGRGYLVASAVSLASLLMAFTFGAAQTDFRLRQSLVATEASAIGTAYLRTQLLERPARGSLSPLLLRYAELRANFFAASADQAALARHDDLTRDQQARIWTQVSEAVRNSPSPTLSAPLLQSVNEMFDSAEARAAAEDIRVPAAVLQMLVAVGIVSAALIGFAGSEGRRYPVILAAVLLIQTLALCLILALDRPNDNTVTINQRPLSRVVAEIRQGEARRVAVDGRHPLTDLQ